MLCWLCCSSFCAITDALTFGFIVYRKVCLGISMSASVSLRFVDHVLISYAHNIASDVLRIWHKVAPRMRSTRNGQQHTQSQPPHARRAILAMMTSVRGGESINIILINQKRCTDPVVFGSKFKLCANNKWSETEHSWDVKCL